MSLFWFLATVKYISKGLKIIPVDFKSYSFCFAVPKILFATPASTSPFFIASKIESKPGNSTTSQFK